MSDVIDKYGTHFLRDIELEVVAISYIRIILNDNDKQNIRLDFFVFYKIVYIVTYWEYFCWSD